MAGGIRGQCPSVAANKWENGTSVYIFPMLANNVDLQIFGLSNVLSYDFHAIIFSISFSKT